ncbi:MAG: hypothetical protein HFF52_03910 [Lawsonibacter sp.]|nr:hypothetical protein [Lawsonibacter sp.]
MGLFDRFKKKESAQEGPKPPKADTMCLLLMDRVLEDIGPVVGRLQEAFGAQSVSDIDTSHANAPSFIVTVDGLEFWCVYPHMPVPKDEMDIPLAAQNNLFLSPEVRQDFCDHKSFWVIVQKGGGTTLENKRRTCWTFSLVCAAFLELEGAVGVCPNENGLLVSRENYLFQRTQMEGRAWDDPEYFPVTLWIWLYRGLHEDKPTVETWGLKEFGLPELGFFNPELPVQDILNYLFTMSCFQITGRQLYRNMALVPLTGETEVVGKQNGDKIYFIGA